MESDRTVRLMPVAGLPEVGAGDDLVRRLGDALEATALRPQARDILVVAHKIVSKAEGAVVDLRTVVPTEEARKLAAVVDKDPRKVEVILRESSAVLRVRAPTADRVGVIICRHRLGLVSANAAVDESNVPGEDRVLLLPRDPDASARALRVGLQARFGVEMGVVIADTFGRPWRLGLVNVAVGLAGVPPLVDLRGTLDRSGRTLHATMPAVADELAAAAGLLMGKADGIPAVLVRDFVWEPCESSATMLHRIIEEDLFA